MLRDGKEDDESTQLDGASQLAGPTVPYPSAEKVSHLPSWVLQMRAKIEASRIAHSTATSRLNDLNKEVNILGDRINEMLPTKPHNLNPTPLVSQSMKLSSSQNITSISNESPKSHSQKLSPLKNAAIPTPLVLKYIPKFHLQQLPEDILSHTFDFLEFFEIFRLRQSNKSLKNQVDRNFFWMFTAKYRLPFLFLSNKFRLPTANKTLSFSIPHRIQFHREEIESYLRYFRLSLHFIAMMKEQRSIPKFKQVAPRRYNRNDRQITHPLPLFDGNNSTSMSTNNNQNSLLMSHAETLNSDFRTFAHHALEAMVVLSSALYPSVAHAWLNAGVVTVMVSLLSNEEATIQNYSCTILANLLGWDACSKRNRGTMVVSYDELANGIVSHVNLSSHPQLLIDQLNACNGRRQLPTLLTSPSAAVNLVQRSHHLQHSQHPHNSFSTNDNSSSTSLPPILLTMESKTMTIKGTSRIQGVCNMSASRALINMFYPDFPVHSDRKRSELYQSFSNSFSTDTSPTKTVVSENKSSPTQFPPTKSNENRVATKSGLPNVNNPPLFHPLHHQLAQEYISRPWKFTYFYKSGAFKDQFITQMRFFRNGLVVGSGHDNIGAFIITGELQREILGQTLFIQKQYLTSSFLGQNNHRKEEPCYFSPAEIQSDRFLNSLIRKWSITKCYPLPSPIELQDYLSPDEVLDNNLCHNIHASESNLSNNTLFFMDSSSSNREFDILPTVSLAAAHVVHIAYWSDGIPDFSLQAQNQTDMNLQQQEYSSEPKYQMNESYPSEHTVPWSEGLWGVWETHSNQAHYELQKGGVFRALPVEFN